VPGEDTKLLARYHELRDEDLFTDDQEMVAVLNEQNKKAGEGSNMGCWDPSSRNIVGLYVGQVL
jgi:hypothetical protein